MVRFMLRRRGQDHSQPMTCDLEEETSPMLCRLRMSFRHQDLPNMFLQDYRCVVTVIRQEDVDVDVCDKCYSLPCVCVAQVFTCLGRRRVALIRDQNRKRLPRKGPLAQLMSGQKRTRRRSVLSGVRQS